MIRDVNPMDISEEVFIAQGRKQGRGSVVVETPHMRFIGCPPVTIFVSEDSTVILPNYAPDEEVK